MDKKEEETVDDSNGDEDTIITAIGSREASIYNDVSLSHTFLFCSCIIFSTICTFLGQFLPILIFRSSMCPGFPNCTDGSDPTSAQVFPPPMYVHGNVTIWGGIVDYFAEGNRKIFIGIYSLLFSGLWPHIKSVLLLFIWFYPMKMTFRSRTIRWIIRIGMWSLVGFIIQAVIINSLYFQLQTPYIWVVSNIDPSPVIVLFAVGVIVALVLAHWIRKIHRALAKKRIDEAKKRGLVNVKERFDINDPAVLPCLQGSMIDFIIFVRGNKGYRCSLFGIFLILILSLGQGGITITGYVEPILRSDIYVNFTGYHYWSNQTFNAPNFTYFIVNERVLQTSQYSGSRYFVAILTFLLCILFPLIGNFWFFLLLYVPFSLGSCWDGPYIRKMMSSLSPMITSFCCLDVFVVTVLIFEYSYSSVQSSSLVFRDGSFCVGLAYALNQTYNPIDRNCGTIYQNLLPGALYLLLAIILLLFIEMLILHGVRRMYGILGSGEDKLFHESGMATTRNRCEGTLVNYSSRIGLVVERKMIPRKSRMYMKASLERNVVKNAPSSLNVKMQGGKKDDSKSNIETISKKEENVEAKKSDENVKIEVKIAEINATGTKNDDDAVINKDEQENGEDKSEIELQILNPSKPNDVAKQEENEIEETDIKVIMDKPAEEEKILDFDEPQLMDISSEKTILENELEKESKSNNNSNYSNGSQNQ